jgi:uncharacterized membrane protein
MSVWLGGLVLLGIAVLPSLRRGTISDAGLRRWSITAYSCVICLVVTGEYQASRQVSPVQALWSTRYGVILLVKVALVVVMLAAALLAERRIIGAAATPVVPGGAPDAITAGSLARAVRRSVGIETITAVLVLAVTAVLVSEPPARTTFGPPVTLSAPLGTDHVSVRIDTTRRGPQAMTLRILNATGAPCISAHRDRHVVIGPGGRAPPHPAPPHPGRLAVSHQRRGRPAAGRVDPHPQYHPRPGRRLRHLRQLPGLVTDIGPATRPMGWDPQAVYQPRGTTPDM